MRDVMRCFDLKMPSARGLTFGLKRGAGVGFWLALGLGLAGLSCSGAGPYGYAQVYTPLEAEQTATAGSVPYDPSAILRKPERWKGRLVTAFGMVEEVQPDKREPERLNVTLSLRTLQARNLCQDADDSTCRVTVSEQSFGSFRAVVPKRLLVPSGPDHPEPVQPGSLLRVIGSVTPGNPDADEPATIQATLVRHWPLQTYVTTAERESMRR